MNHLKATRKLLQLFAFSALTLATSCVKNIDDYKTTTKATATVTDIFNMTVPANFNFSTEKTYDIDITLLSNDNAPLHGVPVKIMTDIPENNGLVVFSGISNSLGKVIGKVTIPATTNQVIINTDYFSE